MHAFESDSKVGDLGRNKTTIDLVQLSYSLFQAIRLFNALGKHPGAPRSATEASPPHPTLPIDVVLQPAAVSYST